MYMDIEIYGMALHPIFLANMNLVGPAGPRHRFKLYYDDSRIAMGYTQPISKETLTTLSG